MFKYNSVPYDPYMGNVPTNINKHTVPYPGYDPMKSCNTIPASQLQTSATIVSIPRTFADVFNDQLDQEAQKKLFNTEGVKEMRDILLALIADTKEYINKNVNLFDSAHR